MKDPAQQAILIVDDEAALRDALAFDFEMRGFTVFQAENGVQALEILAQNPTQVVLTDVRMPLMDGTELLDEVRKLYGQNPAVIFLSGYSDLSLPEAHHHGADAVFGKPFSREALASVVNRTLLEPRLKWKTGQATPPSAIRSLPRLSVALRFPVLEAAAQDHLFSLGYGGFFLATPPAPAIQPHQEIEFTISTDQLQIEGIGRALWTRGSSAPDLPAGSGIEIVEMSDASIRNWVDHLSKFPTHSFIPMN